MSAVFQKPADYEPRGRLDPAGFALHAEFRTWEPPADLAPFIEHGWCVRWDEIATPFHNQEVMHRPYVDFFVEQSAAGVQGTFRGRRTYVAEGSGRVLGLRFRPGGFTAIWPGRIADLQDRVLDLGVAFPTLDPTLADRVRAMGAEEAIASLFNVVEAQGPQPDPRIGFVNQIIAAAETNEALTTVRAVAASLGRSERWVQQLFRDYTGIGLKWFLRRVRLLAIARAIRAEPNPDWADLAYRFGYASQQHFNTEFKQEIGQTPRQYWRASRESPPLS